MEPSGIWYPGSDATSHTIGDHHVVRSSMGAWLDGEEITTGSSITIQDDTIVYRTSTDDITLITTDSNRTYSGASILDESIVTAEDTPTSAWVVRTASGYAIAKDGTTISESYMGISDLTISKSGYDTMGLGRTQGGELMVVKNGTPIENVRK
jgi:hypothetical protein